MNIYHFTKFESLLSILRSGRLYFSNLKNVNDPSEGLYSTRVIANCLKENEKNNNDISTLVLFYQNTIDHNQDLNLFSISFTGCVNNLHMWKEYGDYGKGVAIEFDKEKFTNLIDCYTNKNKNDADFLQIKEVIYNKKTVSELIKGFFQNKELNSNNVKLVSNIICLYPLTKHNRYKIEKEYRICFVCSDYENFSEFCDCLIGTDNSTGNPRHYININYLKDKDVIKSIFLGSNITLYQKKTLKDELKDLGFNVKLIGNYIPICNKEDIPICNNEEHEK